MSDATLQIDERDFWRLAAATVAVLLPLNWSWHVWGSEIPGSLAVYIVAGGGLYFGLLRLITGLRFVDLSYEARFIVISSMFLLIVFLAFGRSNTYLRFFEQFVPKGTRSPLLGFFYFATCSVILRMLIPYVLLRFKLTQNPADYGYRVRGGTRFRWVYFGLFVLMIPLVLWASSLPDFQGSYPQTRGVVTGEEASIRLFLLYHAAYFMVFLSGESFWRGYMNFGLGRDLGVAALPWMVMMYSIGHYGKPILEVNASIIAGFVLGYLALRHRSFFLGALLHWSIALTMDLAVLWQRGVSWH
ncbi:MAG: type II CAAX prenyl endopeptidase Rce1 family protein [Polyangiales bacterium]